MGNTKEVICKQNTRVICECGSEDFLLFMGFSRCKQCSADFKMIQSEVAPGQVEFSLWISRDKGKNWEHCRERV